VQGFEEPLLYRLGGVVFLMPHLNSPSPHACSRSSSSRSSPLPALQLTCPLPLYSCLLSGSQQIGYPCFVREAN
jgi:hypothetical protein